MMLHVVREFALDRLAAAGEEDSVRRAYARYFHALAERAGAARGAEQERRYERVTLDLNNLRAILAWATGEARQPVDLDEALDLAGTLWFYWIHHSRTGEARLWLTRALELAPRWSVDPARQGPAGSGRDRMATGRLCAGPRAPGGKHRDSGPVRRLHRIG